jgi:aldose 1-epimerase
MTISSRFTSLSAQAQKPVGIKKRLWGTVDRHSVFLYTLTNSAGMTAQISNYGATIVSLTAPDRRGRFKDVVCGYDNLESYRSDSNTAYYGATIGRYGNRIAKGQFSLDGKTYQLPINNGPNSLHGGIKGLDKKVWSVDPHTTPEGPSLTLTCFSADGEEGYPGNLSVKVVFTLLHSNALQIDYAAASDRKTVINLTNHSYFNLAGAGSASVLGHKLLVDADGYLPVDKNTIPFGPVENVAGTPFDFRTYHVIGERIDSDHRQIKDELGYDHNFVLNHGQTGALEFAVGLYEPICGRAMEVWTTLPGIQVYTANYFDGELGKKRKSYKRHSAVALETQRYPDSPNHPEYPSTELVPGQFYQVTTIFRFSTI